MKGIFSVDHHVGWRVSNKVFITLSITVVVLTWTLLIVIYPSLPATIPTHFGWSGRADATAAKNWINVFLPGIIQVLVVGLTWWASRYPQYSHLPSTIAIRLIPEPLQTMVKKLLAHMMVMTGLVTSLIMAYLTLGTVQVSLGLADRLNTWALLGLIGLLLLIIGVYTAWLLRLTRHLPDSSTTMTSV